MIKLVITLESKDDTSFSVVQNRENNNANCREEHLFRMFRDATATVAETLIAITNGSDVVVATSKSADIVNNVMRQAQKEHDQKRGKKKGKQ